MDKTKVKILVVNDKIELRSIIRDYLRDEGYRNLSVTENGLQALRKAASELPDLIVADMDLPGLSGLELLREIRQNRRLKNTPFVMLCPETEQREVARAAEFRVSAIVVKPFSQETLCAKIGHLLQRRLNPAQADTLYHEANMLVRSGESNLALERYQEALEATQGALAHVYYKLGKVHETLSQESEAETNYKQAVETSDLCLEAYDALGALNLTQNRPVEAKKYIESSLKLSPQNARRHVMLGEALLASGDFEAAEQSFKKALAMDPSLTHLYNRLAMSLRRQKKLDEAILYYFRALEITANDENLYFNLSRAFRDQGDINAALVHLENALKINPDFQKAKELLAELKSSELSR